MHEEKKLVYLACPYTHEDRKIRVARFNAANIAAGKLMAEGHIVFSPISHTHPIAEACDLSLRWEYWAKFDKAYLQRCSQLIVLCLDGWPDSRGVKAEIEIANSLGLPISYMAP